MCAQCYYISDNFAKKCFWETVNQFISYSMQESKIRSDANKYGFIMKSQLSESVFKSNIKHLILLSKFIAGFYILRHPSSTNLA